MSDYKTASELARVLEQSPISGNNLMNPDEAYFQKNQTLDSSFVALWPVNNKSHLTRLDNRKSDLFILADPDNGEMFWQCEPDKTVRLLTRAEMEEKLGCSIEESLWERIESEAHDPVSWVTITKGEQGTQLTTAWFLFHGFTVRQTEVVISTLGVYRAIPLGRWTHKALAKLGGEKLRDLLDQPYAGFTEATTEQNIRKAFGDHEVTLPYWVGMIRVSEFIRAAERMLNA